MCIFNADMLKAVVPIWSLINMLFEAQANIPEAIKQLYIAISLCFPYCSTVNSVSTVKWTGALCIEIQTSSKSLLSGDV